MKYRPNQTEQIEAVQWNGNNLREVQDLMFPSSPSKGIINDHIGVFCSGSLTFAAERDWIVRTGGEATDFRVMSDREFQKHYTAVEE